MDGVAVNVNEKIFAPKKCRSKLTSRMEVVEWSARLARKRALRVRCLLAPLSMMHLLQ